MLLCFSCLEARLLAAADFDWDFSCGDFTLAKVAQLSRASAWGSAAARHQKRRRAAARSAASNHDGCHGRSCPRCDLVAAVVGFCSFQVSGNINVAVLFRSLHITSTSDLLNSWVLYKVEKLEKEDRAPNRTRTGPWGLALGHGPVRWHQATGTMWRLTVRGSVLYFFSARKLEGHLELIENILAHAGADDVPWNETERWTRWSGLNVESLKIKEFWF